MEAVEAEEVQTEEVEQPEPAPDISEAPAISLSDEDVDRVARRVVELLSDGTLQAVAWEVVPDMAETVIRERLRELESQVE